MQIMYCIESGAEYLVGLIQMIQVGARVVLTIITTTFFIQGLVATLVRRVSDLDHARTGKQITIARIPCRHNAIKHVYTSTHSILGRTH